MKKTLFVLLVLSLANAVWADVPKTINYQGRLTDLNGNPVVDGTHSITISLYTSATATTAAWADNFPTATKNGYFSLVLGSGTQKLDTFNFNQQYWVGLRVDTDSEMTPRQPLNSVPYALAYPGPQLIGHKVLTAASGTYVPTAGTKAILVEVQGGGGGGGGATYALNAAGAGAGGGGGGYAKLRISDPAASYDYIVGASAAGGSPGTNNGTVGMASSFSVHGGATIISCNGGGVGQGSMAFTDAHLSSSGGLGGTSTGGDINIMGGCGKDGIVLSNTMALGASGGASVLGFSGMEGANIPGGNGTGYGAGGSGGGAIPNTNQSGGNGAPGVIIISEFK